MTRAGLLGSESPAGVGQTPGTLPLLTLQFVQVTDLSAGARVYRKPESWGEVFHFTTAKRGKHSFEELIIASFNCNSVLLGQSINILVHTMSFILMMWKTEISKFSEVTTGS